MYNVNLNIFSIIFSFLILSSTSYTREKNTLRFYSVYDKRPIETHIYKKMNGIELKLLLCKPDNWKTGDKRAAMVWIHGGGWVAGNPEMFQHFARFSAARGAVGISLQYRLMKSKEYRSNKKLSDEENKQRAEEKFNEFLNGPSLMDLIKDSSDAIRFIRKNAQVFGIDPQRISAIGDSAGSHLATSLGTIASEDARVNAVIACSSISDLTYKFGRDYIKPSKSYKGKKLEDDPNAMKDAKAVSPIFHIKKGIPFLVLSGGNDWLGDEPNRFVHALKKKDIDHEHIHYPQAKHAFIVYNYSATLSQMTQALLDLDAFLLERGLLDGPTSIKHLDSPSKKTLLINKEGIYNGEVISNPNGRDFPTELTVSFKVKLPEGKLRGSLVKLDDKYGFNLNLSKGGHDFTMMRFRQRGKQFFVKQGDWQKTFISLGKDRIILKAGDIISEIENKMEVGFAGRSFKFADKLNAEIKDIKIYSTALPLEELN